MLEDKELDYIKSLYSYNPESGVVTISSRGYLVVNFFGKTCYLHRLIWVLVYGKLPDEVIDHINGVKTDNRLVNLRDCNQKVNRNNINNKLSSKNTSGFRGISWDSKREKWCVRLLVKNKYKFIGYYNEMLDAVSVLDGITNA